MCVLENGRKWLKKIGTRGLGSGICSERNKWLGSGIRKFSEHSRLKENAIDDLMGSMNERKINSRKKNQITQKFNLVIQVYLFPYNWSS